VHINETDKDYFTTAYFHRPEEFRNEIGAAGFEVEKLIGIEGPAWHMPRVNAYLEADGPVREEILQFLDLIEEEPSIVGASSHLLCVALKGRA
jgi:hypothetical protein